MFFFANYTSTAGITNKHRSQHRPTSSAQVALGIMKSLVAPNHGSLSALVTTCCILCASIAGGVSRLRSGALVYGYHFWFVLLSPAGVFLHSRVTGSCPLTTDLIVRVNARTIVEGVYQPFFRTDGKVVFPWRGSYMPPVRGWRWRRFVRVFT